MRLLDCFADIFSYTAYLTRRDTPSALPYDTARQDLEKLFERSQELSEQSGASRDESDNARFAVCAWVDETILCSEWNGRIQWLREPLQRVFFNTATAGEEFVERLSRIRPEQNAVREVFTMCLALGYQGPFFEEHGTGLEDLKRKNARALWGEEPELPKVLGQNLFPTAYPPGDENASRKRVRDGRSTLLMALVMILAPLLLVVLYLVYGSILDRSVSDFFARSATAAAGPDGRTHR